ncbi:MAG: hypothetical protein KAS11_01295 [Candidatus Aenigmarchaeota archaeon]|nr:hypothetical protein [Candidatus Aenigmarchaeota archaeon]
MMRLFAKKRKGQNIVLEEILFVALSIVVLTGVSATFNSINDRVSDDFEDQNVAQISNFILSAIDRLVFANVTSGYIVLDIPSEVSRDNYIISGFNPPRKQFMIKMGDNRMITDTPVFVSGIVSSSGRSIKIEYDGSSIFLRGGMY